MYSRALRKALPGILAARAPSLGNELQHFFAGRGKLLGFEEFSPRVAGPGLIRSPA